MLAAFFLLALTGWASLALFLTLAPLYVHWVGTRKFGVVGGRMAADVPFTGHETLDDILRRYIVLLALANGALLAGASFLGQAGNLLWIAVVILAAPFWALQLIVLHVTSGHLGMPFPWSLFDKDRKEDIGEW